MKPYELLQFHDPLTLAHTAAKEWLTRLEPALKSNRQRPYLVGLSGGRIAGEFFRAIVQTSSELGVRFNQVHFFWADERCVPPNAPESNFNVANELLLRPLGIRPEQIHRIQGEISPEESAQKCEAELRQTAKAFTADQPVLDMVFLGMGEEGHVASLFPTLLPNATDSKSTYLAVTGSKPPPRRITLSYAALAGANEAWVLASGPGKEEALRKSLMLRGETPLARLLAKRPLTRIFSDVRF